MSAKRFAMRVSTQKGMVDIDSASIHYGNIRNMYKTGSGYGLQLSEDLEHKRSDIASACFEIAEKIYKLQDILSTP